MKTSLLFAATLALGLLAGAGALRAADDILRRAQQALRDQGFYYGPVDGAPGDETTQALRRYQIRNGLAVSGQLNEETLRSLQIRGAAPSSPATTPGPSRRAEPTPPPLATPAPPTVSGRTLPPQRDIPAPRATPTPPPAYSRPDLRAAVPRPEPNPRDDTPRETLPPGAQPPSAALSELFARSPLEFAPPPVQADVLRRAQRVLGQEGFYNGAADGVPGPLTSQAIAEFQGAVGLRRTARLDETTLRSLRLRVGPGSAAPAQPRPAERRRRAEPEGLDDEDEEDAPAVRIRPRGPRVYDGRIVE